MIPLYAELYYGSSSLRFEGTDHVSPDGLIVSDEGIEGWWSSPDLKTQPVERASGNGAHDIAAPDIDYSSRTVTMHFTVLGDARSEVLESIRRVSSSVGLPVRLRVVDDTSDTFVSGMVQSSFTATWERDAQSGTLTVVCPRPERLSWQAHEVQLLPTSRMQGGLSFGPDAKGLVFPLSFGLAPGGTQNTGLLVNNGSATAYPVLAVTGSFPNGVLIQFDGQALEFSGSVGSVPLTLDARPGARTAFMGGQDVSRQLVRRDWPEIPHGGSLSLHLMSSGSGWVTATSRDTYI